MSNKPPKHTTHGDSAKEPNAKKTAAKPAQKSDAKGTSKRQKPTSSGSAKQGLAGFQIGIDAFGTVNSNLPVDAINRFLDHHVEDRKLNEREGPHADDAASSGENA